MQYLNIQTNITNLAKPVYLHLPVFSTVLPIKTYFPMTFLWWNLKHYGLILYHKNQSITNNHNGIPDCIRYARLTAGTEPSLNFY